MKKRVDDMLRYLEKSTPRLWSKKELRSFLKRSLYIALYKDTTATGYHSLMDEVRKIYNVSIRSLRYNAKVIRKHLAQNHIDAVSFSPVNTFNEPIKLKEYS
jgi:hypothetical protein